MQTAAALRRTELRERSVGAFWLSGLQGRSDRPRHPGGALFAAGLSLAWLLLCGMGPYRPAGLGSAALGTADAVLASGVGGAALYANPAGMSQVQHGVIEGGFARSGHAGSGAPFVSFVDSTSDWGLAAGVGYSGELGWGVDAPKRSGQDLRMGLSAGGQTESGRLLLGGAARYLSVQREGGPNVEGWTSDFGVLVGMQALRLGAVVHNALQLDPREAPRRVGVAAALVATQLIAEVGGSWGVGNRSPLTSGDAIGQSYRAGLAYMVGAEGLQLRAGYQFDQIVSGDPTHHWVCAGLSWRTPSLAFDLGGGLDASNNNELMVSASVTLLVPTHVE